ncbi:hypothetical protein V8F33_005073 [Rhypophila sp. PSN 637]
MTRSALFGSRDDADAAPRPSRSRTFDREERGQEDGPGTSRPRPRSVHLVDDRLREKLEREEREHQTCVPIRDYKTLLNRKEEYKTYVKELEGQVQNLKDYIEQTQTANRPKQSTRPASGREGRPDQSPSLAELEKQHEALLRHYHDTIAFLRAVGKKDLKQAEFDWARDAERFTRTENQLKRLQEEVLTAVDRFDPNFDSKAVEKFKLLNGAVGKLSKAKELTKLVLADPLIEWDRSVLWKDSVAPSLSQEKLSESEKKLLLRQVIWKFFSAKLFDRSKPFASYGGSVGELAASFPFDRLFPDHETNDNAGKWRSVTIQQLNAHPESDDEKKELGRQLALAFAAFTHKRLLPPGTKVAVEEVERAATEKGDFSKRLDDAINQALGLSRLLMGERAAFALKSPSLKDIKFTKEEDDDFITALGHTVGVVDGADVESDVAGKIRLMGSPMLVKYGDAGGKNLDQETVVVRAFVVMEEAT